MTVHHAYLPPQCKSLLLFLNTCRFDLILFSLVTENDKPLNYWYNDQVTNMHVDTQNNMHLGNSAKVIRERVVYHWYMQTWTFIHNTNCAMNIFGIYYHQISKKKIEI